jgi:Flp pilus assembly protein TadD
VPVAQLRIGDEPGKADAAVKLLEKAIALRSDSADAYYVFGCLMDRAGNYARAVGLLEKCVQLQPDDAPARYRLGRLCARSGDRHQADAEFAAQARLKQAGRHSEP